LTIEDERSEEGTVNRVRMLKVELGYASIGGSSLR